jgi:Cu/Ag efflux pump CusA
MNTLTLLAFVLAIGLVVDDAIVVLENIHRRIELGEKPLVASFLGTRQVGFAVIATTLVLLAVFVPVTFMPGDTGRMFAEFSVTLAISVGFSGFVALTLSPMLASKIMRDRHGDGFVARLLQRIFEFVQRLYRKVLDLLLNFPATAIPVVLGLTALCWWLLKNIPEEFTPREDRGSFFVTATTTYTGTDRMRRCSLPIGVSSGQSPDAILALLPTIASSHADVLAVPAPGARLVELGKDRYGYSLEFSINDPLHADVVSADLRLAVCRRFQELGMDPPN